MAYDPDDAERIQRAVGDHAGAADVTTKSMFGGIAFFVAGKMAVGIYQGDLLVRVPPESHEAVVALPHARAMVQRGREMRGWVQVGREGWSKKSALAAWAARGVAFAASLSKKPGGAKPKGKAAARGSTTRRAR